MLRITKLSNIKNSSTYQNEIKKSIDNVKTILKEKKLQDYVKELRKSDNRISLVNEIKIRNNLANAYTILAIVNKENNYYNEAEKQFDKLGKIFEDLGFNENNKTGNNNIVNNKLGNNNNININIGNNEQHQQDYKDFFGSYSLNRGYYEAYNNNAVYYNAYPNKYKYMYKFIEKFNINYLLDKGKFKHNTLLNTVELANKMVKFDNNSNIKKAGEIFTLDKDKRIYNYMSENRNKYKDDKLVEFIDIYILFDEKAKRDEILKSLSKNNKKDYKWYWPWKK